jgi:hypothetical protein
MERAAWILEPKVEPFLEPNRLLDLHERVQVAISAVLQGIEIKGLARIGK